MKEKRKVEVDVSGRIDQKSYDSVMVMLAEDGSLENSVFLSSKLKRKILNENKDINDIIVKVHCILIYYCVKDFVGEILGMKICPDCSPKKIDQYLNFYFREVQDFDEVKKRIKGITHSSLCHKKALRIFRGKEKPRLIIDKEMIMKLLMEVKKK